MKISVCMVPFFTTALSFGSNGFQFLGGYIPFTLLKVIKCQIVAESTGLAGPR